MNNVDIGGAITNIGTSFVLWLPNLIAAIVYFIIGWVIAAILGSITSGGLIRMGLNRRVFESPADSFVRKMTTDPARSIGNFIYWLVLIITIAIAIDALKIPVFSSMINAIFAYIPNILGAIVIAAIALGLAALFSGLVMRWMGDTPTGKVASTVVPVIIITIAGFSILEELKLAPVIISTTYIAIVGAIALGFAIAFGIGGADTARQMLSSAYGNGKGAFNQAKEDVEKGRRRAEEDADKVRRNNRRR